MMKRSTGVLLVMLLAAVPAALAGGWATVVLDELPGEINAGEPEMVSFMVLQHGQTPVHNLGGDEWPVEPIIETSNALTGESVTVTAVPAEEVGRFVAEITFPTEGEWSWSITPMPFNGSKQLMEPLTVLPALPAAGVLGLFGGQAETAAAGLSLAALVRWAGLALILVGLVVFAWQRGRRPSPAPQTQTEA